MGKEEGLIDFEYDMAVGSTQAGLCHKDLMQSWRWKEDLTQYLQDAPHSGQWVNLPKLAL